LRVGFCAGPRKNPLYGRHPGDAPGPEAVLVSGDATRRNGPDSANAHGNRRVSAPGPALLPGLERVALNRVRVFLCRGEAAFAMQGAFTPAEEFDRAQHTLACRIMVIPQNRQTGFNPR